MSEDRKSRYISYLVDRVNETELDKKAMELVLEDFLHAQQAMKEELADMRKKQEQIDSGLEMSNSKLNEEVRKRKKAERDVEKLKAQLAFATKNKFGDKGQKVTKCEPDKPGESAPDRTNEKENFDGTNDTLETKSVSSPSDTPEPKKEKPRDLGNRPDTYNAMSVHGKPMEHPSDDAKVPGRILDRKMVKVLERQKAP